MLLGIYDDLLMGSGLISGAGFTPGTLHITGWPTVPNGPAKLFTTPDLVAWQTYTMPAPSVLTNVAVGDGKIVCLGVDYDLDGQNDYAAYVTANNGASWSSKKSPLAAGDSWGRGDSVAFGNGVFVNASSGHLPNIGIFTLWTSTNGATWTQRTMPMASGKVYFAFDRFVMVGYDFSPFNLACAHSTDGINWTRTPDIRAGGTPSIYSPVEFLNDKWVVGIGINNAAEIAYTTDFLSWTRVALPWPVGGNPSFNQAYVGGVTYLNGLYYAIGSGGSSLQPSVKLASSPDLHNWTNLSATNVFTGGTEAKIVTIDNKLLVTADRGYPPSGISMTNPPGTITYTGPASFGIWTSPDGDTFTPLSGVPSGMWLSKFTRML